jgi:hypothetical protein
MKQGFAIPLREEDLNWCTWIIGEVEYDQPPAGFAGGGVPRGPIDLNTITRRVVTDEDDVPKAITDLTQALNAAGMNVTFIRDARLYWTDL